MQSIIERQAAQLRSLRAAIQETAKHCNNGTEANKTWSLACSEFDRLYDELAFPGGLQTGLRKIAAGDLRSAETAIVYLELRPFYYRAQFVRNEFCKLLKQLSLPPKLESRFEAAQAKVKAWRAENRSASKSRSERLHALAQSRNLNPQ